MTARSDVTAEVADRAGEVTQVAYLGPVGTFSHQAASQRFRGRAYNLIPHDTIRAAVHALLPSQETPRIPWAVIPIRNSTFGPVLETHQVIAEPEVIQYTSTLDEQILLEINHCLVGRKSGNSAHSLDQQVAQKSTIQRIASHVQALGQCQQYLRKHYPSAELIPTASTAQAATLVTADQTGTTAAICSAGCIEYLPDLEIMASHIQDAGKENVTTFIILRSKNTHDP